MIGYIKRLIFDAYIWRGIAMLWWVSRLKSDYSLSSLILFIITAVMMVVIYFIDKKLMDNYIKIDKNKDFIIKTNDVLQNSAEKLISELLSTVSELEAQLALEKLKNNGGNKLC